jgi:hypothetical protein
MPRTHSLRPSRPRFAALLCLILLTACDESLFDFDYDPDSVPLEEIIDLTRTGSGPLSTRGTVTDALVARIPSGASTREITLFTSAGFFELNNLKEVKVRADRDPADPDGPLVARVVLRADTLTTTAVVSATIATFRDTVWVPMIK